MTTLARKLSVTTAVAGLATLMATGIALAAEPAARAGATKVLVFCDGGAQESVITNSQNTQTQTASFAFVPIPSTTLPGGPSGAAGDADTYTVTFSGEAGHTGGSSWEIQAQASVNGGAFFNIDPIGPNIFHSGVPRQTHTMTWCERLIAANSTNFRVVWRKAGGGFAIVDDYLIQVQRSD